MLRRSESSLMSRWSMPSMRMTPDCGVPHAMQQRQRRALARAGRADEGHRRAGRHVQVEMLQRRPQAVIGEVHILEVDVALGAADILAVGLVRHGRLVVEHAEEVGQRRHLEEDAADEARGLVHAADQHGGEAHEAHDLADRRLALGVEPGAEHEDRITVTVEAARVSTDSSAHQFSTGYCAASVLADDAVHLAGLGAQPHEALDQVDVAQRVARRGRRARCDTPRPAPAGGRSCRPPRHWRSAKKMISTISSEPEPPVHEQAERQHDEQRHEGREVLAEEATARCRTGGRRRSA